MSEIFEKWGRKYCERSEWISIDRYWIEEAWDYQQEKIDALEKKLAGAIEALKFYGQEKSSSEIMGDTIRTDSIDDMGFNMYYREVAKVALEKLKELEKGDGR